MASPGATSPRRTGPVVRTIRLVDLSGERPTSLHRPLRAEGTPNSKGLKALQSMLNLPEAAARAVRLFDSNTTTTARVNPALSGAVEC